MCDYKLAGEFKIYQENKEKLNHDFDEIKEQNIKQQKIGQQIMANDKVSLLSITHH